MGASLRGDKRYDELLKWVPADDPDPSLQVCRADALWSTGQADEANQVLAFVLKKDPLQADALLLSARIAADSGQLDSATHMLEQLLERNPHDVTARYQLALVQRQAGKLDAFQESMKLRDQTQALIDRMIELNEQIIENPGDPRLCLDIATICDQLGKTALAESWRKAAEGLYGAGPVPEQSAQPIR
jgi:Flp pilus assembly protein TadD